MLALEESGSIMSVVQRRYKWGGNSEIYFIIADKPDTGSLVVLVVGDHDIIRSHL